MERIAGLTQKQVEERFAAHADNYKVQSSTKSISDIVKSNLFTYFNLVFTMFTVLLVLVGAWSDLLFLPIVIANIFIGLIQEIHSKNILDRLTVLNTPKIKTIRDGNVVELFSEELVLDDVIILEAGNQIPADAVVLKGDLQVNEALITGEADEITKKEGDQLLSGSFVISGNAYARLDKVGKDSYISKLVIQATQSRDGEQSEMMSSLNQLILVMGIIIIPIGVALFVQAYVFNKASLHDSVTSMVAAVIGMIPEGLFLLASVAMAASCIRLAKRKVLVHDMKCIETLARADVLCVDKTGTITENGMQVYSYEVIEGEEETVFGLISDFVSNMSSDNETMCAMQKFFGATTGVKPKEMIPFSSQTKYSGVVFDDLTYIIGAPEFVLREEYFSYQEKIEKYSVLGFRVLIFAMYQGQISETRELTQSVIPKAIIILTNPIRKGAKEIFSHFASRNVEIKVISGDNPLTVSQIALEAGVSNADKYIDAALLKSKNDMYDAVNQYTVFGRVTPKQKSLLVQALKEHGKTVAMTGDGVNDVLALKQADCSIAMASGSDAASNVSQMVLLNSDFSKMKDIVMEGRRVVNNIERTASLYIVKNIFSMLLSIFSVAFMWEYPLEPSQVSLISMFTIGIPSFVLALQPNEEQIKGHFLANILLKALPAGITDFIVVSGLVLFCREFQVDLNCLSTSCTVLVGIVGFMILYQIAKPLKKWHIIMICALIAGWLFCMLKISHFFEITGISRQCAMLMIVFAIITEPVFRYLNKFVVWCGKIPHKVSKERDILLQDRDK